MARAASGMLFDRLPAPLRPFTSQAFTSARAEADELAARAADARRGEPEAGRRVAAAARRDARPRRVPARASCRRSTPCSAWAPRWRTSGSRRWSSGWASSSSRSPWRSRGSGIGSSTLLQRARRAGADGRLPPRLPARGAAPARHRLDQLGAEAAVAVRVPRACATRRSRAGTSTCGRPSTDRPPAPGHGQDAPARMTAMRITTLNLRGFFDWDAPARRRSSTYLRGLDPDVILFQEVVFLPEVSPFSPVELLNRRPGAAGPARGDHPAAARPHAPGLPGGPRRAVAAAGDRRPRRSRCSTSRATRTSASCSSSTSWARTGSGRSSNVHLSVRDDFALQHLGRCWGSCGRRASGASSAATST